MSLETVEESGKGQVQWLVQKPEDDVATALVELPVGMEIASPDGTLHVTIQNAIPFGHKFALHEVKAGLPVHKYGQVIGVATQDIRAGEHVHVHNIASTRGRGDLAVKP